MATTVLYIDDDLEDLQLFEEAVNLISHSIKFIPSRSAIDALKFLQQQQELPQLIFVDINMPLMDGKEFLKTLKVDAKFRDIPVIIYTTSQLENEKEECKMLGAENFITKPTSFPGLISTLKAVISF